MDDIFPMEQGFRRLRRCAYLCCVLLVVSFPCLTLAQIGSVQIQGAAPNRDPAKTYSLSGTVVNALTGEPISRALVQAGGGTSVMTATDGSFELTGLPVATYVTARKPRFFSDAELHPGSPPNLVMPEGAGPVVVKLTPQAIITGHVMDSSGEPIENIPVSLAQSSIQDGIRRWTGSGQTTTNENGEFRLSGLKPGRYMLSAGPALSSPSNPQVNRRSRGYARTYYANVSTRSEATAIPITSGQHAEFDFSLETVPMYQVSGTVTGTSPDIGVGWDIVGRDGENSSSGIFYDPTSGSFRITLPQGLFTIKTVGYVRNGQPLRAEANVNLNGDLDSVVMALQPSTSIPIDIRYERTRTDASALSQDVRPNVYLRFIPEGPFRNEYFSETPQNEPPLIRNIDPGKYWVRVENAFPGYVQALRCGSQDLTREKLTITAGQHSEPIEVVLRDNAATLNVSMRSDSPIPGRPAVFAVSGADNPEIALRMAMTWTSGTNGTSAELNGLAPGDYTVYAFDKADNLEYRNPDVLSAYSSRATHVTLAPNGKTDIVLDLIRVEE